MIGSWWLVAGKASPTTSNQPPTTGGLMILVFIEHVDGKVNKASYEAVRAAQLISGATGQAVSAVIFGSGIGAAAGEIAAKKLGAVYTVENDALKSYTADGYSAAFKQVIEQLQPELVLMTHTYEVRDFAPKLAASLRRALVGDCISHKVEGGEAFLRLAQKARPIFLL